MPPVAPLSYLTLLFHKIGRVASSGLGIMPLPYTELRAFAEIEGGVTAEDLQTLREMSSAYCVGLKAGEDPFAEPPWSDE